MGSKDEVIIYHNPRCTKSRQTLALLRENGVEPKIIEYLKDRPGPTRIRRLIKQLGIEPHGLVRAKEAAYKERGLTRESSAKDIVQAIADDPILLERPIVVRGDRAVFGRPPDNVLPLIK
jgi:arsenate reductase